MTFPKVTTLSVSFILSVGAVLTVAETAAAVNITGINATPLNSSLDNWQSGWANTFAEPGFAFNIYVTPDDPRSEATPTFLNSGDSNPETLVDLPLSSGVNTFFFLVEGFGLNTESNNPNWALNLFFEGNNNQLEVSARVVQDSPGSFEAYGGGTVPLFAGLNTQTATTIPAAGTLQWQASGNKLVELIDFQLQTPNANGIDLISGFSNVPSGSPDHIGQFTLEVTQVPTPALLPGLIGFGMSIVRKKRKQEAAA